MCILNVYPKAKTECLINMSFEVAFIVWSGYQMDVWMDRQNKMC